MSAKFVVKRESLESKPIRILVLVIGEGALKVYSNVCAFSPQALLADIMSLDCPIGVPDPRNRYSPSGKEEFLLSIDLF